MCKGPVWTNEASEAEAGLREGMEGEQVRGPELAGLVRSLYYILSHSGKDRG
jgi:hypothetical protein